MKHRGDLGRVLDLYIENDGRYAQELGHYRSLVDTGDSTSQDEIFKALLREAGSNPVMQSVQDNIFAAETWDPAQQWFDWEWFHTPTVHISHC